MRLLFLLGILILNVAAFAAQQSSFDDKSNAKYPTSRFLRQVSVNRVVRGAAHFSGKFVKEVAKNDRDNLIVSPLGASLTLSMASFGARGNTETVFREALGLSYIDKRKKIGFQTVIDQLNSYKEVELHVANGVFVSSGIKVNPEFIEVTRNAFRSLVQNVDFSKSDEAGKIINGWCEKKTHSRIKEIVNADDLNPNTALILVNAIYFKGTWLKKFNPELTDDLSFYREDGTLKDVPAMNAIHNVRYGKYPEVDAEFIELPYLSKDRDHNISMFVILPKSKDGLVDLEKNFERIDIKQLLSRGEYQDVNIFLPKFKIESELQLNEPLKRMKMGNIFDSYKADFSGIIASPESSADNPLDFSGEDFEIHGSNRFAISRVVQKAFIEINEEGSEAAAATDAAFGFRIGGGPRHVSFVANHPFYAIIATTGKNPLNLFTARFTG